jgi:hypothetical protein
MYGEEAKTPGSFAQTCLMARRLANAVCVSCRCITVVGTFTEISGGSA